ncbi:MAG: outer membrane beta-barrel protein [Bacteroidota bacterium]
MKKIIILIAVIVFCSTAKAQIAKGRMMLGAGFNTNSQNHKDISTDTNRNINTYENKTSNFNIELRYGYFISDHLMLGVFGGYGFYQNKGTQIYVNYYNPSNNSNQTNTSNNNTVSGGLFARYYTILGTSRFAFYGQISSGYGGGKNKSNDTFTGPFNHISSESHGNHSQFSTYINPGLVYFINNHIAIETSFGSAGFYTQRTKTYTGNTTNENTNRGFNASLSLYSLYFGLNFYFGGNSAGKETKG